MAKDIRQDLRDTAEDVDLAGFFREAADATGTCRNCKAPIPDWSARANIIRLLLEQGYGKPKAQDDEQTIDLSTEPGKWTPEHRAQAANHLTKLGVLPPELRAT